MLCLVGGRGRLSITCARPLRFSFSSLPPNNFYSFAPLPHTLPPPHPLRRALCQVTSHSVTHSFVDDSRSADFISLGNKAILAQCACMPTDMRCHHLKDSTSVEDSLSSVGPKRIDHDDTLADMLLGLTRGRPAGNHAPAFHHEVFHHRHLLSAAHSVSDTS